MENETEEKSYFTEQIIYLKYNFPHIQCVTTEGIQKISTFWIYMETGFK